MAEISSGALAQKLIEYGATMVGISWIGDKLPVELAELPYAVTIAVRLSDFVISQIKYKPTFTYFHHYRAVNALIDQITLRGALLLQEKGYYAMTIAASQSVRGGDPYSGVFPHKTGAVRSGMGWIGKNGLLVTAEYGPRVRLGTILTNAPLQTCRFPEADQTAKRNMGCGECRRCVEECPAMALTGNTWHEGCDRSEVVDAAACSQYMSKQFKDIGRGVVCGLCIVSCPRGSLVIRNGDGKISI